MYRQISETKEKGSQTLATLSESRAERSRAEQSMSERADNNVHLAHSLFPLSRDVSQLAQERSHYGQELSEQNASGSFG